MKTKILLQQTYSPLAVTVPVETAPIEIGPEATSVAYVITVTNAVAPTGTIRLQGSLTGVQGSWTGWSGNPGIPVAANGVFTLTTLGIGPLFRYYRVRYNISSGSYTATTDVLVKGESL